MRTTEISSVTTQRRSFGVALMLTSGLSNQFGAAMGSLAFPVIGPAGVVAVRQWVAAIVLLTIGRPKLRSYTWSQWWPILLLAVVFGSMNLTLYSAIGRIGLGLAVTLEFVGPLTVALAASRRRLDVICAVIAGLGVVVLARPQPTTDYLGIALALVAAGCWAAYILLNRTVGRRLPGTQGSATAAGVSGLLYVPIGIVVLIHHPPTAAALTYAGMAGILSSTIPFLADLFALRRVPARYFGLFMSVSPIMAAAVGFLVLGQALGWIEWLGIFAIVAANTLNVVGSAASLTRDDRLDAGSPASSARRRRRVGPSRRSRTHPKSPLPTVCTAARSSGGRPDVRL